MKQPTHLPIDELIMTNGFVNFLKSVRDFCDFIESNTAKNHTTFLKLTKTYLQQLYISGLDLQFIDLNYDISTKSLLAKTSIEKTLSFIADRLDNNRFYWVVFDPTSQNDTEPVCGDLLDDLGDIYKDLKNSLLLFDKGTPAEIENAVWEFKWSFDNHWGDHCINAIYALHYFIKFTVE